MRNNAIITVFICWFFLLAGCQKEPSEEPQETSRIVYTERVVDPNSLYPSGTDIAVHYNDGSLMFFSITIDDDNLQWIHECKCIGNRFADNENGEYPLVIPDRITTRSVSVSNWGETNYSYQRTYDVIGIDETCQDYYPISSFDKRITSLTVPNSAKNIGVNCFADCSYLTKVSFPNSIHFIGESYLGSPFRGCSLETATILSVTDTITDSAFERVFKDCSSGPLSLYFDEGIKYIGRDAFYECSSVTSISFPNSVYSIGDNTFSDCTSLTSILLPNAIQEIGYSAFENCSFLNTCICYAIVPPTLKHGQQYWWGGVVNLPFDDCPLQAIYVPRESVEAYKTAEGWEHYADIIYPIE